jgi:hypothetical protein
MTLKNFIVSLIFLMIFQFSFTNSKAESNFVKGDLLAPKIDGVELLNQEKKQHSPIIKLKKDAQMVFTGDVDNELINVQTENARGWIKSIFVKKFTLEKKNTGENQVAEWKLIGENARMVTFVHLASVTKSEQSFNIWLRAEIKDPKPFGNFTSHSFKTNDDVDCKNTRRRTVSQTHYSEHMLLGEENPVDIAGLGKWQPWDPTLSVFKWFETDGLIS